MEEKKAKSYTRSPSFGYRKLTCSKCGAIIETDMSTSKCPSCGAKFVNKKKEGE